MDVKIFAADIQTAFIYAKIKKCKDILLCESVFLCVYLGQNYQGVKCKRS